MKRFLTVLLCFITVFCAASCNGNDSSVTYGEEVPVYTSDKQFYIGMWIGVPDSVKSYTSEGNVVPGSTRRLTDEEFDKQYKFIKEAGFTILMDDFGSGYSSLNMLKTTQFDVLKIDRSFLSEFMESDRGRKIIHHTISMSRDIGLDIIAEGVETLDQANFLNSCGCDAAQGFYYSRPIPAGDFDEKFRADRKQA